MRYTINPGHDSPKRNKSVLNLEYDRHAEGQIAYIRKTYDIFHFNPNPPKQLNTGAL